MAHVFDVAHYILDKKGSMSAMKLQKLAYYSQAWHLVFDGKPLFESEIEAWANGPVVRALYNEHRGQFTVDKSDFSGTTTPLSETEIQTIDAVLEAYGDMGAHALSNLTHSERPWLEARDGLSDGARSNAEISVATMLEFYEEMHRTSDS